ncbi:MAG TPA: hypothetical protein VHB47_14925 [Thermoanaerobaculia bacterium]|jgi:hypothetical protein|nr:hypothetical protein [Thermoanaerobaculia bacterium]
MPAPLRLSRARDVPRDAAAGSAAPAVDPSPLVGTWVSFDAATRGLVRVVVALRGGRLAVRAFGASSPAPQDWGEAEGDAFAGGVDGVGGVDRVGGADRVGGVGAVAFTARYRFGFVDVLLAAYLNRRLLVVDCYSVFGDGSGRSSYFSRDHFYQPAESASRA